MRVVRMAEFVADVEFTVAEAPDRKGISAAYQTKLPGQRFERPRRHATFPAHISRLALAAVGSITAPALRERDAADRR